MKIILACENKKIKKYFSEIKNNNLIIKKVQYREAIIDIIKKENNISFIFLYEKIPGEISIEDLIKKIKLINKKIKIIIFLEKENIDKKIKLKNLEINNIYLINKINKKIFINILNNNSNKKILKNNQNKIKRIYYKNNNCFTKLNNKNKKENLKKIYIKKYIKKIKNIYVKIIKKYLSTKNKFDKKDEITKYKITKYKNKHKNKYKNINVNKNKLIGIFGEKNSGKTTIIYLIIIFLLEKNNKILLINLNNKNNYSKLNNKNINKKNNYKIIKNNYKKIKNTEIKNIKNIKNFKIINLIEKQFEKNLKKCKKDEEDKNIIFIKNIIKENKKIYDYILMDIGYIYNKKLKEDIIKILDKKVYVCNKNILGIKEFLRYCKINNYNRKNNKRSLHIIQNKYNFNSLSNLIVKNILGKFCYAHKLFYDKNFLNLEEKFLKNQKIKLKIPIRKLIKKIVS